MNDRDAQFIEAGRLAEAGRYGESESIYRKLVEQNANDPDALHFLGLCLVKQGSLSEGFELIDRSVRVAPTHIQYRLHFALLLSEIGEFQRAESVLLEAAEIEPQNPQTFHYLGMAQQKLGRFDDAIANYEHAIEFAPHDPNLTNNVGHCWLERGDLAKATYWLHRSLESDPRHSNAHNNLGTVHRIQGQLEQAVESFRQAVKFDEGNGQAWCNLGNGLRAMGNNSEALEVIRQGTRSAPGFAPLWQELSDVYRGVTIQTWNQKVVDDLTLLLETPKLDLEGIADAAASLILHDPSFPSWMNAWFIEGNSTSDMSLPHDLFGARTRFIALLFEKIPFRSPMVEQVLVQFRSRLLDAWRRRTLAERPGLLDLLCGLAQQAFLNEYIWDESSDDASIAESLIEKATSQATVVEVALLASIRPLSQCLFMQVGEVVKLPDNDGNAAFERMWRRQVDEPRREAAIQPTILSLTSIDDPISLAVRTQYEEHPYPRWQEVSASQQTSYPYCRSLQALFPDAMDARSLPPEKVSILIAGCGSGLHPAQSAYRNPAASILAIDLSRTSLAFAIRRCSELGLDRIRFAQADILKLHEAITHPKKYDERLGEIPKLFDVIESVGVLHHLDDPMAGWRALVSLLKPGGYMRIGLYSEIARNGIASIRDLLASHFRNTDLNNIRAARHMILNLPNDHPGRWVARTADFFTASTTRDLILHTREHRFSIERLRACIDELQLEFLGFEPADPAVLPRYRALFPNDPTARSFDHWQQFENEYPQTFRSMYQFWLRHPVP